MGSTPWYEYLIGGPVGGPLINRISKDLAPKSPDSTAPALPSESAASQAASTSVSSNRAALLASGGQTDETGGLGLLTGSDVATTALIGG